MRSELWENRVFEVQGLSAVAEQTCGAGCPTLGAFLFLRLGWVVTQSRFLFGIGFRRAVESPTRITALQATEKLNPERKKCQGTTSVVPHMQQNDQGALAPAAMILYTQLFLDESSRFSKATERSARR
jgi:hypothetical protein